MTSCIPYEHRNKKDRFMTKYALFILFILSSCGGTSSDPSISTSCLISPRILSGTPCEETLSPVVKISLSNSRICSGVFTSPKMVLTAAHCLINNTPYAVTSGNINFPILSVEINKNFRDDRQLNALFNDTAIITVKTTSPSFITPLSASTGETIRVFGYGQSDDGSSGMLMATQMKIYDITHDHLVSYYDSESGDACFGDSGGPAIITRDGIDYLAGIVSSGSTSDCSPGEKVLFTRID